MASLGVTERAVGLVLNHTQPEDNEPAPPTTRKVYNKYKYLAEKKEALDAWGKAILQIIVGKEPDRLKAAA